MHRKMVQDLCALLAINEEQVFCGAKHRRIGFVDPTHTENALDDLGNFRRTGKAPEYVEWHCLYYLSSVPHQIKAVKTSELVTDESPIDESLVGSLFDNDPA